MLYGNFSLYLSSFLILSYLIDNIIEMAFQDSQHKQWTSMVGSDLVNLDRKNDD